MHYIHRYSIKTLEKIITFFVLFSLIFLLLTFFFVGKKKGMFEQDYRIRTILNEGYGLTPGTIVKLAGIEVGTVDSVNFTPENKVEVVMKIRKKFQEKIRNNSIVSIAREGLAGEKFLNITLGAVDSPILENEDKISAHMAVEITDIAQKITPTLEYIEKISDNIFQITEKLVSPEGELSIVLKNIREITTELNEGKGSIGYLLKDDRKMYKNAEEVFSTTKRILGNLEMASQNLEKSAAQAPPTVTKVQETIEEAKKTVEEVKKLIIAAQKHWLLRGYVQEDETRKKEELPPKKETPQPTEKNSK
jgi:phospholipid/cholesterol/gamma-HCH transport system substrate-binding protein